MGNFVIRIFEEKFPGLRTIIANSTVCGTHLAYDTF